MGFRKFNEFGKIKKNVFMELEKFIVKRIKETTGPGWILSAEGDTIDVYVPGYKDINEAERSLKVIIELFVNEFGGSAKPVKYIIWNDQKQEISGVTDPSQKTEWVSIDRVVNKTKYN